MTMPSGMESLVSPMAIAVCVVKIREDRLASCFIGEAGRGGREEKEMVTYRLL
jgi:hypothetical protein